LIEWGDEMNNEIRKMIEEKTFENLTQVVNDSESLLLGVEDYDINGGKEIKS